MQQIDVGLEWFLNPDHLPFIVALEKGWFRDKGLDVRLHEPEGHYDSLAAVIEGRLAFACNEPLHMVDAPRPGLKALGCFFETDGGVMLTPEGESRLSAGESIRIASPVAGEVTDDLARLILQRWCEQREIVFDPELVQIEAAGFEHLENLQGGFHGAWLCFANFEGVEARHLGVEATLITTAQVGLPNFSALELFTGKAFLEQHGELVDDFIRLLSDAGRLCIEYPDEAMGMWYRYTGESRSELMDAIVRDTCLRLVSPVIRDAGRWREMWRQFDRMGISQVDQAGYEALYSP